VRDEAPAAVDDRRGGRARLPAALGRLAGAAERDGLIRPGVAPEDLANALSGISLANSQPGTRHPAPGTRDRADRLVGLLVDGLRYGAPRDGS
jgi:hypothetical protein